MKLLLATAALVIILFSPDLVRACSCVGTPSVCGAYAMAEAVFAGTVTRVENKMAKNEDGREYLVEQYAYVQVDEAFKGVKAPQLIFRSYLSSCDVHYEEGQRRLFYAFYDKEDKAWSIGACGRSAMLQHAADDLLYLRGLPASAGKTRIGGVLSTRDQKPLMGVFLRSGQLEPLKAEFSFPTAARRRARSSSSIQKRNPGKSGTSRAPRLMRKGVSG